MSNLTAPFITIFLLLIVWGCSSKQSRSPSSTISCQDNGEGCPFLIIGHRGAPLVAPENTLFAFKEAMHQGANALEIDIVITKDLEIVVFHDRDPSSLISLIRQSGLEGQKYVPYLPNLGNEKRVPVEQLTLNELREFYGYALREGFFKDTFTSNTKDQKAYIPSLSEFSEWSNGEDRLEAVFLDIKLIPGQENLAVEMANQIAKIFSKATFRIFMMTQYDSIYEQLSKWVNENPNEVNRYLTLDLEQKGALQKAKTLKNKLKRKVRSLALGATIFRSWSDYIQEVDQVLKRSDEDFGSRYPIVSWTVDDEKKLYELLQLGVDGILTNRPDRLSRLIHRHWKDHSTAAKMLVDCYQKSKTEGPWHLCSSGSQIAPLYEISFPELRSWACESRGVHETIQDFFGCGGIFDKKNIQFTKNIKNDPTQLILTTPNGGLGLFDFPGEVMDGSSLLVLNYLQESCKDGPLNYKCEYFLKLKSGVVESKSNYKNNFSHLIIIPHDLKKIFVSLNEMDDGLIDDSVNFELPIQHGVSKGLESSKGIFRGKVGLEIHKIMDLKPEKINDIVLIEYNQIDCDDGVLNYRCEYKLKVELIDGIGKAYPVEVKTRFKNSFLVFLNKTEFDKGIKLTLSELDDEEISDETQLYLELFHGNSMSVLSPGGVFQGEIKLKFLNYDDFLDNSEGVEEIIPYKSYRPLPKAY